MSVRTAVEKRDAAVEAAPAAEPLHVLARKAIERQAVVLQQILPQHMSMERFEQIALAQVKGTPGLLRCFETPEGQVSLLYSVVQAAAAGLELGSVAQQAWLIPYQRNVKVGSGWQKRTEARLQISDRGVRTLAARDPRVRELVADVVREGDRFTYRRTLDGDIFEHEVTGPSDRPLTHAYCLIRWRDGGALPIVMDRAEIEYIRDTYSEGWKGELDKPADKRSNPWSKREARMWIKTVIHQARRELNVSPEVAAVLASDADGNAVLHPADAIMAAAEARGADPIDAVRQAMRAAELPPPADENGEPWPVDAELVDDDPEPPASTAPDAVTVDHLMTAAIGAGLVTANAGLGSQRKQLVAVAAELVGVTGGHADELVADQAVAEELLAKLTPAAQ